MDFKTDHVAPAELAAKVQHYEPQLKLYALALERIFRRKVTTATLHFPPGKPHTSGFEDSHPGTELRADTA